MNCLAERARARRARLAHVGACLPIYVAWTIWVWRNDLLGRLMDYWPITVAMVGGSFIGGATCEGGGAIAFPVLTLGFGVTPAVARNFAFVIQSVGMTMASLIIFVRGIPIEKHAVFWASIGGALGLLLGTAYIAPFVPPKPAKLLFVSIWLSFGIALYLLNRQKGRQVCDSIEGLGPRDAAKLLVFGVGGGVISSIFGSGLNDLVFCLLTLHFRVSEKVATPTSVVLMAINAVVGTATHGLILNDLGMEPYMYWLASVPVVIIFAPLGAALMANRERHFISRFLYAVFFVQFAGAFIVLRPTPLLLVTSATVIAIGAAGFVLMSRWRRVPNAQA